jgi:hypothetical protein
VLYLEKCEWVTQETPVRAHFKLMSSRTTSN